MSKDFEFMINVLCLGFAGILVTSQMAHTGSVNRIDRTDMVENTYQNTSKAVKILDLPPADNFS